MAPPKALDPALSVDAIVENQIYVGNLSSALSKAVYTSLGITHVLSICIENVSSLHESTDKHHLQIRVQDSEYEDLLTTHFSRAIDFIQGSLDNGGRVLVHCVMGISRSPTVVCAYLMWKKHWTASTAIRFVKQRRPVASPNYGFTKQLRVFADCSYVPGPSHPAYSAWRRSRKRDVARYLRKLEDVTAIVPKTISLTSDFPEDPDQAGSLLADTGTTHFMTLSPAKLPSSATLTCLCACKSGSTPRHQHFDVPPDLITSVQGVNEGLLCVLPDACDWMQEAVRDGGQVLVHCPSESRACVVVCAFLIHSHRLSPSDAHAILERALPLFNPTETFTRYLQLFSARGPMPAPPPVWNSTEGVYGKPQLELDDTFEAWKARAMVKEGVEVES